ncbi:MAG: hypothetical protein JO274_11580, partial [Gammaproteobacteria bacterium]|nr:hypothetical protein [Gammaproteobacteria bacterium]
MTRLLCLALALLSCASFSLAADAPPAIAAALQALESVHALTEVALSPDGRQLVYGTSLTGSRGGN